MILSYDTRRMGELLQSFYALTKIRIVVFNDAFQKVAEAPGYDSAFCRLIRADPAAEGMCRSSDKGACERCRADNKLHTYLCPLGLTETVAPIRYGKMVIGYLMFGQIVQHQPSAELWEQIRHRCMAYQIDMEELRAAFFRKKPVKPEQISAAAKILEACAGYLYLERSISLREDSLPSRIDAYITGHMTGDLSVDALCGQFQLSRTRLYKVIREYYSCGVEQLIRSLRVAKAKDLLLTTAMPVTEVAYQVGYPDYNYFIKVFRNATGTTPRRYRAQGSL